MREILKYNMKIKLIALMSAIVLWIYVIAIVDPEEKKILENVPVMITNMSEIKDENLMIYPEQDLVASLNISGKLSSIKNIGKNDIKIYGHINNPIGGKNEVYLTASTSRDIDYKFKNNVTFVNLEKIIEKEVPITINVDGNKEDFEKINAQEKMKVIGPRSVVENVDSIFGEITLNQEQNTFTQNVEIKPLDKNKNVVENVALENENIDVEVVMLTEKTVDIELNVVNDSDKNITCTPNKTKVVLKGSKSILDNINSIKTQEIKESELINITNKDVNLIIPENIKSDISSITISIENKEQ